MINENVYWFLPYALTISNSWGYRERKGGNKTGWVKRLHMQVRNKYN